MFMKTSASLLAILPLHAALAWTAPGGSHGVTAALELRLAGGTFRPMGAAAAQIDPAAPEWYRAAAGTPLETSARGRRYLVALARAALSPAERRQIEAAGAELLDYLPVHGYRLRLAPGAEAAVRGLSFVAWLGELPRHLKIDGDLGRRAATMEESPPDADLRVILAADEPPGRTLDALRGLKTVATPSGKDGAWRVAVRVPGARLVTILARLAGLPEVEAVEPARPLRLLNQDAVWVHQSFVGPSPQQTPIFDRGIFGCDQIVGIADSGQDYDMCFFRDTVNGPPPIASCALAPCPPAAPAPSRRKDILYYNWSGTPTGDDDTCPALITGASGHGTHTSSSIAGDTPGYADCAGFSSAGRNGGDGQAPGAKLVVQEMGDGLEYLNDRGGTLWNLANVAFQNGARIHSHSWGTACFDLFGACIPGCTMPYDSFARDADLATWTYPDLMLVIAAGNAGEFCPPPLAVGSPANAKNPLGVGSLGHGPGAGVVSAFSSHGPVSDGRLKPTVAAQGEATVSAASDASPLTNNCSTCALDGTSMATPTVAGLAALVREYYTAGFYAAGTRNPALGFAPSGALLKATLIDGAVALGGAAPAPDFEAGYGRALLDGTLAFSDSPFSLRIDDHRSGLTTGGVVTHAYDVSAGTPFRATLVWTDPPAALNTARARVNELKLEVIDPGGTVWFQTLDPTTGAPVVTASAAAAHDELNVEERLVFQEPAAGRWVVRVVGLDVPWGPQPFALVVRGALTDCPATTAPGAPALVTPADHEVRVTWGAVSGAAAYNVYRSLGACPGGPWIPAATGVTGTSLLDEGRSGGTSWSYYITAASDASGHCESPPSPCSSIIPAGDCTLTPAFAGVAGAGSPGSADCAITLSWAPAAPYCGSEARYNVYRGVSPGFTPDTANRIARCVMGTTWTDSVSLASGVTHHYIVRSEDATTVHGGPCRGGNEDANLARVSAAAAGPSTLGTWSDDAGDTVTASFTPASPWTSEAFGGDLGPKVYAATSFAGACADLTSPVLTLAAPGEGPQLTFSTRHTLDYDPLGFFGAEGSLGQVEIATGPAFGNWTRVLLTPDYPAPIEFPLNDCPTTADLETYFSGDAPAYSTYSGSLVDWAGGDAKIRFHLSGDYLFPSGTWWIDDVAVTKALLPGACTSLSAGPPPVPDGAAVPGDPMQVARVGGQETVTWDAGRCPATAVNIYWGNLGDGSTFTGGVCNLPATGSATLALPDNVWFVVAATDGMSTDGSYSRDLSGAERFYAGASLVCSAITLHMTNNGCP